jgi:hypothetical protein
MTRPYQIAEIARLFDTYFHEELGDNDEAEEAYAYEMVHGVGWETGSRCERTISCWTRRRS